VKNLSVDHRKMIEEKLSEARENTFSAIDSVITETAA
jgi:hypothetical protein